MIVGFMQCACVWALEMMGWEPSYWLQVLWISGAKQQIHGSRDIDTLLTVVCTLVTYLLT
jgi:hypothetical protein